MNEIVNQNNMQRDRNIDILRGIGIFFVVFGHITHIEWLRTYIWGFHIPIFFFISGILFNRAKYPDSITFIKVKVKNLLIPYCVFYIVTFLYWLFIERHTRGVDISPLSQMVGLIYGTYNMKYMMFNGALWFIPCLFSIEILYWFIVKLNNKVAIFIVLILMYIIGISCRNYISELPFGMCAALIGVVFYGIGDLFKNIQKNNILKHRYYFLLFLIMLQILLFPFTGADLATLRIENVYLYIPIAITGIGLYWIVSCLIKKNFILQFLGINSLVIFALQEPVYRAVIFIFSKISHIAVEGIRHNLFFCLIITFLSIVAIFPAIYIWNKWGSPLMRRIKI